MSKTDNIIQFPIPAATVTRKPDRRADTLRLLSRFAASDVDHMGTGISPYPKNFALPATHTVKHFAKLLEAMLRENPTDCEFGRAVCRRLAMLADGRAPDISGEG